MIETISRSMRIIGRERRTPWLLVVALGLAASLIEAIAALTMFALFSAISSESPTLPVPGFALVEPLFPPTGRDRVAALAICIAVFYVLRGAIALLHAYAQHRTVSTEGLRLSVRLLREYVLRPYAWHQRTNSSTLIRNINESAEVVARQIFLPLSSIAAEGSLLMAMAAVLFLAAPVATLAAAALMGVTGGLLVRAVQPKVGELGTRAQDSIRLGLQELSETFGGIRDIKLRDCAGFFVGEFAGTRAHFARSMYLSQWLSNVPRVALETVFVVAIGAFLVISSRVEGGARSALPILGLFAYAVLRTLPALNRIMTASTNMRFGRAGLDLIYDDLVRHEAPEPLAPPAAIDGTRSLECRNLSFRYSPTGQWVLRDIDLRVRPGEYVGIVGATGSGKSTLIDLLVGLLEPTTGTVSVGSLPLPQGLREWQSSVGLVPQALFLSDSSIKRNVGFGLPESEVDVQRVEKALQEAQLAEFVATLPAGLETTVGEAGVRLSGGQRQRIGIARALYHDPEVLIFDEGTSALDGPTEQQVMKTLNDLRGTRTIIVVAHRLSTVQGCDRIVLLQEGRIAAVGTYQELVETSSTFRGMTLAGGASTSLEHAKEASADGEPLPAPEKADRAERK